MGSRVSGVVKMFMMSVMLDLANLEMALKMAQCEGYGKSRQTRHGITGQDAADVPHRNQPSGPVQMSSPPSPPKPKPGSLRDRIAAFEQKPASSPAPPLAPRPKPGNLSQWKPRSPSPPDAQPANDRNDTSMSASDAKESITKGGSLKERMAALQGLGAFGGGGPTAAPPPKPTEKPKWKPPPQVALVPPITGDEEEDDDSAGADNKPAISPLKATSDDISAVLSKHPQPGPTQEGHSEVEGEAPVAAEEVLDPDEEERQRRAAIAARMARLGGTRVGMGPPIFGRKPEIKPKPVVHAPETTVEGLTTANVPVAESAPRSEDDAEHAQAETEVAGNGVYICASCCLGFYSLRVSHSTAPHLAPDQ